MKICNRGKRYYYQPHTSSIWGSHSGGYEVFYLLGYMCRTLKVSRYFSGMSSLSSYLLHAGLFAWLVLRPWRWRWYIPPYFDWFPTDYTALYPRRQTSFSTLHIFMWQLITPYFYIEKNGHDLIMANLSPSCKQRWSCSHSSRLTPENNLLSTRWIEGSVSHSLSGCRWSERDLDLSEIKPKPSRS
jgi:hypothetical protein